MTLTIARRCCQGHPKKESSQKAEFQQLAKDFFFFENLGFFYYSHEI
jgi:hypothetical protein